MMHSLFGYIIIYLLIYFLLLGAPLFSTVYFQKYYIFIVFNDLLILIHQILSSQARAVV